MPALVDIASIAAAEAAKTVAASMAGSVVSGVGRLVKLLTSRLSSLPSDPAALAELIARQSEADPAFAAEVIDALAELGHGGSSAVSPFPPEPFVDRDAHRQALGEAGGVWLIAGLALVGKTALVQRVAHDVAARYPHGQVYVDLDQWRDGDSLRITEIQAHVLDQLGVGQVETPPLQVDTQYLAALIRRRFVLVLDNVVGAAELRRLALPWPRSLVLVTARRLNDDLRMWAEPGRLVQLRGLDEPGAWRLLADRCGEAVLAAEPAAAAELLELCDRMPFAIMQVGAALARRSGEPGVVAAMVERLQSAVPEGVVERCLTDAVQALDASTVAGLRVLATHPGEDFTYRSAEAMLGPAGHRIVDELVDAGLAEHERGRLRLPHTVRSYMSRGGVPEAVSGDGGPFRRLVRFYRDTAVAADLSTGDRLRRYPVPDGVAWQVPGVSPIDWLDAESANLVELVKQAHARGRHVEVVQLCGALEVLLTHRGQHWRCAEAFDWGVRSAAELNDPVLRARLHAMRGRIFTLLHVFDRATRELDLAWELLSGLEDPRLVSSVLEFFARLHEERVEDDVPDYGQAIGYLHRAVDIDATAGLDRSLRIHRRMLANMLVKAGQPEQALTMLRPAAPSGERRNDARVVMVLAKAYTALGDLPAARAALAQARALLDGSGANQYELELVDIDAQIALAAGDIEAARAGWGWIANRYCDWGHPRFKSYLERLKTLPAPRI